MRNLYLSLVIIMASMVNAALAQAQSYSSVPRIFAELTVGPGTKYVGTAYHLGSTGVTVNEIDKTYWFAQFSPSVGVMFNDRWAVGVRATFQTNNSFDHSHYNFATLYGQYSFLNAGCWSVFVEGKGSYYEYVDQYDSSGNNLGEIGFSFGARYSLSENFSLVAHYIYTGVEVGDGRLGRPDGCIGGGRFKLDFSPRRLHIGARYTF